MRRGLLRRPGREGRRPPRALHRPHGPARGEPRAPPRPRPTPPGRAAAAAPQPQPGMEASKGGGDAARPGRAGLGRTLEKRSGLGLTSGCRMGTQPASFSYSSRGAAILVRTRRPLHAGTAARPAPAPSPLRGAGPGRGVGGTRALRSLRTSATQGGGAQLPGAGLSRAPGPAPTAGPFQGAEGRRPGPRGGAESAGEPSPPSRRSSPCPTLPLTRHLHSAAERSLRIVCGTTLWLVPAFTRPVAD